MPPGRHHGAVRAGRWLLAVGLAAAVVLALFLVLPLLQAIGHPSREELEVRTVDVASLEPPPPAPEVEPPPEEEPPPEPPELAEEAPPLDLSQLELALQPSVGDGLFGDFAVNLTNQLEQEGGGGQDSIFSLGELDRRPRVVFQPAPDYPPELKRQGIKGTVYVVFLVDERGRVTRAKVEKSTAPAFEKPALEAVRQWRFEPGTRQGEPVPFKIRIPITFNAG